MYLAIMRVEAERVAKYAEFETAEEAAAHVEAFAETYPDAFVAEKPSDRFTEWHVTAPGVLTHVPDTAETLVVPVAISDRQFFQTLAERGLITQAEALAAVKTGDIPAAMTAIVADMPPEGQFQAEMLLSGATEFRRSHALVEAFGAAMGWSANDIDVFWIEAATK